MPTFTLDCFQNEYLPEDGAEVNAIVGVTAAETARGPVGASAEPGEGTRRAEIIIIDASGSMSGKRLSAARAAAAAAIDCIDDGVRFALVAGNHVAWRLYPDVSGLALATASAATREDARRAVSQLRPGGGTAIGQWISLATGLFGSEAGINHAILLTDGKNEGETPEDLERALTAATGVFQCDCRGVGDGWVVPELRSVSTALLGSLDVVAEPSGLTADFTSMMRASMGKTLADVNLRLWTPAGAEIEFVKQVAPDLVDMTSTRVVVDEQTGDYPTGAWGDESRDYHVAVKVKPAAVGSEMLAGRVTLMVNGEKAAQALVRAVWTDDVALSTRINPQQAHYTGQAEMADAIQAGLDARREGDLDTAKLQFANAVALAAEADDAHALEMLGKVVEIDDAATGKIRLKTKVEAIDEITLDTESTKTKRVKR